MTKTLSYSFFAVSILFVLFLFATSTSYLQLGIAIVAYPIIAYFALSLFPRKLKVQKKSEKIAPIEAQDVDKRTFLKLIGATGLSFFIFSLLGKRTETLLFGRSLETKINELGGNVIASTSSKTDAYTMEGYRISEIDDGLITYYGFIKKGGAWFIMQENTDTGSFRYVKGEYDFVKNWQKRQNLTYDYFNNVFD